MPEDFELNFFRKLLEAYTIETILIKYSDYEFEEVLLHLHQSGFLDLDLKRENLELNFN